MGFGKVKPKAAQRDSLKLHEVIEMHEWPKDEWSTVRFLDTPIIAVKRHWIKIVAGKEKREVTIPRFCLVHNIMDENDPRKTADGKEIECPYCALTHGREDNATARAEYFYLANAIIRDIQEDEPRKKGEHTKDEKKTKFKDIRSKSWTPVRVCRLPSSVVLRIQELSESNIVKNKKKGTKKAYDVTDPKYGIDVRVKFKPKGAGTDKYSADAGDREPLTEDEAGYLVWALDDALLDAAGRMSNAQAIEDLKRMELVGGDVPEDDEDDDGYSLGGKSKSKSKKKPAFDDEDDEDDKPKKKKKKPAFDDDEDDEDDAPKSKKKKKPAFDEDDDDDDEPKAKSKKKKKAASDDKPAKKVKKKKPAFDEDDEDDEDDKPAKKVKKAKVTKSKTSKPKKAKKFEFDDEDDD